MQKIEEGMEGHSKEGVKELEKKREKKKEKLEERLLLEYNEPAAYTIV